MACSPAQLESNRRNALRSTGPRTVEGKASSRRNGLKHGLTGAGVVLPDEDAAEVAELHDSLEAEMRPRSVLAARLVGRVALGLVKLDRAARHEARAVSYRMRRAVADFDDARLAEVEKALSWIAAEPPTPAALRNSPEGLALLIDAFEGLRREVDRVDGVRWDGWSFDRLHHLMGLRREDVPASRARALTEAMAGDFRPPRPSRPGQPAAPGAAVLGRRRDRQADRRAGPNAGAAARRVRPGRPRAGSIRGARPGDLRPVEGGHPGAKVRGGGRAWPVPRPARVPRSAGEGADLEAELAFIDEQAGGLGSSLPETHGEAVGEKKPIRPPMRTTGLPGRQASRSRNRASWTG